MKTKICSKCKIENKLSEFNKDKRYKNGIKRWCKLCINEYNQRWYIKNHKKRLKQTKQYYDENKTYYLEYRKIYNKINKEKIAIRNKKWYKENKEKVHKQYIKNKGKRQIYNFNYYIKNKEKIIKNNIQYIRKKLKTDISFRVVKNLRHRISDLIKMKAKSLSTMMLIGCEVDYLMYHLQKRFVEGMSWDNYGDWHIDHIKPCILFDLTKLKEQRKCFHYTNLRPLWAEDNLRRKKYV